MNRRRVAAAFGVGVLLTGGVSLYAYAAGSARATCTANPSITEGKTTRSFTVTCSVPREPAATVTATKTVTVSGSPSAPVSASQSASASSSATQTATGSPAGAQGFPDASNTGVPAGTALTAYTGPMTITANGTVIDGKTVSGQLTINADNVTVRNSRLVNPSYYSVLSWGKNFTIQDSTADGEAGMVTIAGFSDRGGGDIHLSGVNFSGSPDLVRIGGSGSTVRDSYLHDVCVSACPEAHNDTLEVLAAVKNVTIDHNTILNSNGQTSAAWIGDKGGPATSGQLTNNLIGGGGYTLYTGPGDGAGFRVENNQFTTRYFSKIGYWGLNYSWTSGAGNTWTNNSYADGPKAGQPVGP